MKLHCEECAHTVEINGPLLLGVAVCKRCGGEMRRRTDTQIALYGALAIGAGALLDIPLLVELGAGLVRVAVPNPRPVPVVREELAAKLGGGDLDRDVKTLAAGRAKLDRDDPTLN